MNDTLPEIASKRDFVHSMFSRIARRYDLMNKIMSLGQDSVWRRRAVTLLHPEKDKIYLDVGAGTGGLSREILKFNPGVIIVTADLTFEMIMTGKTGTGLHSVAWVVADTQALPFSDETFNGVISGYLLRNVENIDQALFEQVRVIKPAARLVSLDTTPPKRNLLFPFIIFYYRWIVPLIGQWITGDRKAYSYLPESTQNHLPANVLANRIEKAGLTKVSFEKWMLGTMAIHTGEKPA